MPNSLTAKPEFQAGNRDGAKSPMKILRRSKQRMGAVAEVEQLEDNLKAAVLELSAAEIEALSATTGPHALYPQWMIERRNEGRQ